MHQFSFSFYDRLEENGINSPPNHDYTLQQGLPGHRSPVVQLRSLEESFRVMLYPGGMQTHTTIEEETVVVHYRGETLGRIRMPIWATRDDLQ